MFVWRNNVQDNELALTFTFIAGVLERRKHLKFSKIRLDAGECDRLLDSFKSSILIAPDAPALQDDEVLV